MVSDVGPRRARSPSSPEARWPARSRRRPRSQAPRCVRGSGLAQVELGAAPRAAGRARRVLRQAAERARSRGSARRRGERGAVAALKAAPPPLPDGSTGSKEAGAGERPASAARTTRARARNDRRHSHQLHDRDQDPDDEDLHHAPRLDVTQHPERARQLPGHAVRSAAAAGRRAAARVWASGASRDREEHERRDLLLAAAGRDR